ncbi:MAG: hypothetical protein IPJ06_18580 [Saprospiraceae bacterium]|nr:hypothetical protein [Saprospiraceae bacterium]
MYLWQKLPQLKEQREWTPHCISDFFGCSAVDCQYYVGSRTIELVAIKENHDKSINQGMTLVKYNTNIGENEITYKSSVYSDLNNKSGCFSYFIDTSFTRTVSIIKVDSLDYIISGTFEFTAVNQCFDTVKITDGYFDLKYRF